MFLVEPSSARRISRLQEALPIPGACQKQDPGLEEPRRQPHKNPPLPPHFLRALLINLLALMSSERGNDLPKPTKVKSQMGLE